MNWKQRSQSRILIVDDNPSIHEDFKLVLLAEEQNLALAAKEQRLFRQTVAPARSKPAYTLDHAFSGDEGVGKVKQALVEDRPYQLAFVDIRMPGIDGVEAIEQIWQVDPAIQIVICTAFADYSGDDLACRLGPTDKLLVLKKPFDMIEVTQLASTLTEKWFLARQAALKFEEMELLVARRTQKLLAFLRPEPPGAQELVPGRTPPYLVLAEEAESASALAKSLSSATSDEMSPGEDPYLILLVAHNADLGREVKQSLGTEYRVIEAEDSEQAFRQAQESVPDLILTEMAMPGLDGIEFCRRLKSEDLVSHIAVVMFSATAPDALRIKALEAGADDYVLQPFNPASLKACVDKLLRDRRQFYDPFCDQITLQPRNMTLNQADAQFLRRAIETVERHLPDFEFDVDLFAQKMAASKRQLLRKLKAVACCTPKAFIRTLRLKRAAHLLRKSSMNVSEITYAVGFCDLKHFRSVFREQFGVLPVEYAVRSKTPPGGQPQQ